MFSFRFFVVCILVGSVFAAPETTSRYAHHESGNSNAAFISTDIAESVKQLTGAIETSFKGFTQNADWIFHSVEAIVRTTFEKGFVNVATWAVDIITRYEFLAMADGSHLVFPTTGNADVEKEYKTVAIAVSKLLRHLKYMERTDKLLKNVTRTLLSGDVMEPHYNELKQKSFATTEKVLRTFIHFYFETLDHQFGAHDELGAEYKRLKAEAREFVKRNPKMSEPLLQLWDEYRRPVGKEVIQHFFHDKEILREAYVNKLFLKQAAMHFTMIYNATHYTRYLLARAIIEKAQSSPYDSPINKVYHEALVRAGAVEYMNVAEYIIEDVLFTTIEQSLSAQHGELAEEIRVLKSKLETSTRFDASMLHVDFAPL